ncbi:LptA/OstA family protein [uncultured Ferrovibrio sp.]|jgi:lipopolysaccharide export system protein LptA|uniref:LptA/OstA family protein n=1 Tax=uncultured Ferrovibrio sp. TaxID=1576913 RepID=UPI0026381AF6|nr:LptA/OstA family protein [uncultured Ferrovibrio sp.]
MRVFWFLSMAALAAAPALAQVNLGNSRNSDQPIEIASDTLEVQQDKQLAIFRGNVDVVQGDTRLRSEELFVYYRERAQQQGAAANKPAKQPASNTGPDTSSIQRIEAKGKVFVSTPEERAQGDFGVYDVDKKTVTLTGNVLLTTDRSTVRCAKAIMFQDSGRSICEPLPGERVRGVFLPGEQQQQQAAPQPNRMGNGNGAGGGSQNGAGQRSQ